MLQGHGCIQCQSRYGTAADTCACEILRHHFPWIGQLFYRTNLALDNVNLEPKLKEDSDIERPGESVDATKAYLDIELLQEGLFRRKSFGLAQVVYFPWHPLTRKGGTTRRDKGQFPTEFFSIHTLDGQNPLHQGWLRCCVILQVRNVAVSDSPKITPWCISLRVLRVFLLSM